MDPLTRIDVAEYNGVSMVVVESDLLPPDPIDMPLRGRPPG